MNDYSYAAGLMDGEGSISLYRKSSVQKYKYPKCGIDITSIELASYMHKTYGGSFTSRKKPKEKILYRWEVKGQRCMDLLKNILPYLKEKEKVRRATLILNSYKKVTKHRYTKVDEKRKIEFETEFFKNSVRKRFLKGIHTK